MLEIAKGRGDKRECGAGMIAVNNRVYASVNALVVAKHDEIHNAMYIMLRCTAVKLSGGCQAAD